MIHRMKLDPEPYLLIKSGVKKIELRLNDEKRQQINPGDFIIFINKETKHQITVKCINIQKYKTFEEMFLSHEDLNNFGLGTTNVNDMVDKMHQIYSTEKESEYGVVGIEITSPLTEVLFPVDLGKNELKYVVVVTEYDGNLVFCKHNKRGSYDIPGGHIESGESAEDAAIRELYEETGIKNISAISDIGTYYARSISNEDDGAYGEIFFVQAKELPEKPPCDFEMNETKLFSLSTDKNTFTNYPTLMTHPGIYPIILYAIHNLYCDLLFTKENINAEDYEEILKYYNDTLFDYAEYDGETFVYYLFKYPNVIDATETLNKFIPNQENYLKIRNGLLHLADIPECVDWIIRHFGKEKLFNDDELIKHLYEAFDEDIVDAWLKSS